MCPLQIHCWSYCCTQSLLHSGLKSIVCHWKSTMSWNRTLIFQLLTRRGKVHLSLWGLVYPHPFTPFFGLDWLSDWLRSSRHEKYFSKCHQNGLWRLCLIFHFSDELKVGSVALQREKFTAPYNLRYFLRLNTFNIVFTII